MEFTRMVFPAMGTECKLQFAAHSPARAKQFQQRIRAWVTEFEARYSRFRPESLVSEINRAAGGDWVAIDPETEGLFKLCDWFFWTTQGVYDPTSWPLLMLWDYRGTRPQVPSEEQVRGALALVGWKKVQREPGRIRLPETGMGIDLGGIAKEYAVDRVLEMALQEGIEHIMVDFGHDLRVHGAAPGGGAWRIGLEDPRDPGRCWTGVGVEDRAVCTSGDYLRGFTIGGRRYGHILDPRTGYPVNNGCQAVSVIAPTCTEAGLLATAIFVMGPEEGLKFLNLQYQAEGAIVARSGQYESGRFQRYALR